MLVGLNLIPIVLMALNKPLWKARVIAQKTLGGYPMSLVTSRTFYIFLFT